MAILNGTTAADTLTATSGADTLMGAAGDDVFVVSLSGAGHTDVILDFGSIYFGGPMTPGQEGGGVNSQASGTFRGALSKGGRVFDWGVDLEGLDLGGQTANTSDDVIAAHFHRGAPGVAGAIVYGFIGVPDNEVDGDTVVDAAAGTVRGQWDATEGNNTSLNAELNALLAGQLYINFHTAPNPAGEIRGQVLAQDEGRDRIDLSGSGLADFTALQSVLSEVNGSAQITITSSGETYTLVLQNVPVSALSAGDFIFGPGEPPPITPATLTAFTNIHIGRAPTGAEQALLATIEGLSPADRDRAMVDTANSDTAVAAQAYQFFTGLSPTQAGFAFLTNSPDNPTDINDPYYARFNLENRYINFAANLGLFGEGATAFRAAYEGLSFAESVQVAYGRIIGFNYAEQAGVDPAAAIADIISRAAYFEAVAREGLPAEAVPLGIKAAVVGYIMAEGIKADVGAYAAASNGFMSDLLDGSAQFNVDLVGVYAPMAPTGPPMAPPIDPYIY